MQWHTINLTPENILLKFEDGQGCKIEYENKTLIKIRKGDFKNYTFWHPTKLISFSDKGYTLSYNGNFKFYLTLKGLGDSPKIYKQIRDKQVLTVNEFNKIDF